jgi:menaquinone-dependent protoporphyrinogen oxidase
MVAPYRFQRVRPFASGATAAIVEAIGARLGRGGLRATVLPVADIETLAPYSAVLFGRAVHDGAWLTSATGFAPVHAHDLRQRPVWLFSVSSAGDTTSVFRPGVPRIPRRLRKGPEGIPVLPCRERVPWDGAEGPTVASDGSGSAAAPKRPAGTGDRALLADDGPQETGVPMAGHEPAARQRPQRSAATKSADEGHSGRSEAPALPDVDRGHVAPVESVPAPVVAPPEPVVVQHHGGTDGEEAERPPARRRHRSVRT